MSTLITKHYQMLNVLSRFGIALGFGEKSVEDVCKLNQVDCSTFLAVVNLLIIQDREPLDDNEINNDAAKCSPEALAEYLKQSHSYFLDYKLPAIRAALESALKDGGKDLYILILNYFDEYVGEVKKHMVYENKHIFPYLSILRKKIESGDYNPVNKEGINVSRFFNGQHSNIEVKLSELKDIIIKYYPAHSTYELNHVLYDIFECAEDLGSHHYIEDRLFAPSIYALEKEISAKEEQSARKTDSGEGSDILSDREKEILICIAHGLTNKEIATKLYLSTHTINTHRRNIISKLQIHSPAGLTIYAIVNKLVELDDVKGKI